MDSELDYYIDQHDVHCRYLRHLKQRFSIRRQYERLVFKSGEINIEKPRTKARHHIISSVISKYIDVRWRWCVMNCVLVYILMWLIFAVIWWAILYAHGDLEKENLPSAANATEWTPCVREIYSFTSIFLFSIEIHTTIGYGKRVITLECPAAMFTMCIESIAGHFTQSLIVGIVFAKLTRPKNRTQTLIFSKNLIVNQRDGNLCMIFRVGNTRKSRIISVNVNAYLIQHERKPRDVMINNEQIKLHTEVDASDDIILIYPVSVVHRINRNSPFYNMSAQDILKSDLEVIVVFEGIIESTGQPVQAISSYTSQEILWGRRFAQMIQFSKNSKGFIKDFSKFNETYRVNTIFCSGRELDEYYENRKLNKRATGILTRDEWLKAVGRDDLVLKTVDDKKGKYTEYVQFLLKDLIIS